MSVSETPQSLDSALSEHTLLEVRNLSIQFNLQEGVLKAVDGVSFTIPENRIIGLIGESGCGKSVTALSILRLLIPPAMITGGDILYHNRNGTITNLTQIDSVGSEIRRIRGQEISIVFQEPMTSLSPVHSIGNQLTEIILLHKTSDKNLAAEMAVEMLRRVHIANPEQRMREYPHQLSGGMRQRVMIAMALACSPRLLIADEPTTALDVTVQAQILDLLIELQAEYGLSVLYITHNLGVVAELCQEVMVMYLGRIVESGDVRSIFHNPSHPYTRRLLESTPRLGQQTTRLNTIKGNVPIPINLPVQCGFFSRCEDAISGTCNRQLPALVKISDTHQVRCFLHHPDQEQLG